MLKNAYLLAKIGADAAEHERNFAKNWQLPYGSLPDGLAGEEARGGARRLPGGRGAARERVRGAVFIRIPS